MGVLRFFSTIKSHYFTKNAISFIEKKFDIDYLLFDFNSLIHQAKQSILSKYKNDFEFNLVKNKIYDEYKLKEINQKYLNNINTEIQNKTMNYVENIIAESINELKFLYIAIDGVPSIAKMMEQKRRRFMGKLLECIQLELLEKYKDELTMQKTQHGYENRYLFEKYTPRWTSSHISPGTEFMIQFTKNLKNSDYLMKYMKPTKYIFSDYTSIGEAEKKLMNYCIRNIPQDKSIMIYSPDADVILLCMLLEHKKVYVIRNDDRSKKLFCIDINKLKNNFYKLFKLYSNKDTDLNTYIRDLIFLFTFFGDDFVPPIESYTITFHLSNLIKAYANSYLKLGNLTTKTNINNKCLILILKNLTNKEFEKIILVEKYLSDYFRQYFIYRKNYENWCYKNNIDPAKISFPAILRNCLLLNYKIKKNGIKSVKKNALFKILNTVFLKNNNEIQLQIQKNNIDSKINREKRGKPFNMQPYNIQQIQKNSKFDIIYYGIENMLDIRKYVENINWESYFNKSSIQLYQLGFTDIPSIHNEFKYNYEKYADKMINKFKNIQFKNKNPVKDYLDGIMWTYYYYNSTDLGLNNWSYEFSKAPLLTDILLYLENGYDINKGSENYKKTTLKMPYYTPYEQSIFITPFEDLDILPNKVQNIIKNSKSIIKYIKENNPDLKKTAKQVVNYIKPSPINCKDELYISKCKLQNAENIPVSLQKLAKNINFSSVKELNKSDFEKVCKL